MVPVGGFHGLALEACIPLLGHVAALVIGAVEVRVALLQQNGCTVRAKVGDGDGVLALIDAGDGRIAGLAERGIAIRIKVVLADGVTVVIEFPVDRGVEVLHRDRSSVHVEPGFLRDLLGSLVRPDDPVVPVGGLHGFILESGVPFVGHVSVFVVGTVEIRVALLQQNGCPVHAKVGEGDRVLALIDAGDGRIAGLGEDGLAVGSKVVLADGVAVFVEFPVDRGVEILHRDRVSVHVEPGFL